MIAHSKSSWAIRRLTNLLMILVRIEKKYRRDQIPLWERLDWGRSTCD
jgi:hypothetical protein